MTTKVHGAGGMSKNPYTEKHPYLWMIIGPIRLSVPDNVLPMFALSVLAYLLLTIVVFYITPSGAVLMFVTGFVCYSINSMLLRNIEDEKIPYIHALNQCHLSVLTSCLLFTAVTVCKIVRGILLSDYHHSHKYDLAIAFCVFVAALTFSVLLYYFTLYTKYVKMEPAIEALKGNESHSLVTLTVRNKLIASRDIRSIADKYRGTGR
ncbi:hypothetical protein QR680_001215 [Steinernema hermaphroditum]|uniref:Uncharacterized protein n=1 Tax=Steinernema hermaphroditum TaxID=289476 RepID=A0AA39GXC8_9BILA|nr:hypothetical protein QR680_001215 [Steinernema hermaphroditum]